MVKGEIAHFEQFLFFPHYFSRAFFFNVLKLVYIWRKGLTLSKQALIFTCLQYNSFENTVGKGEIARKKQFLFPHSVFYPFEALSSILIMFQIVVCKLFQFGRV